jgi:hypothetical protein
VQLGEPPRQRQPDAQADAAEPGRLMPLREQLEDVGQRLGGDAGAAVADREAQLVALAIGAGDAAGDGDRAARVGELDRVVQQVRKNLHEARVIGVDVDRLRRQGDLRREPADVERGAMALHGVADELRDRRRLGWSWILPDVMRETSSRSSMRRTIWVTWRSIIGRTRATAPAASCDSRSTSRPVRSGASGLRSSCARMAMNSSLRGRRRAAVLPAGAGAPASRAARGRRSRCRSSGRVHRTPRWARLGSARLRCQR